MVKLTLGSVTDDAIESNPRKGGVSRYNLPDMPEAGSDWSHLHELVLEAEINDDMTLARGMEIDSYGGATGALAARLNTTIAELLEIRGLIDPVAWGNRKLRKLIEMERIRTRLNNWDTLEMLALDKLVVSVREGRINSANELLAVASAANRAARRNDGPMSNHPSVNIQINQTNSASPNGDLPGAGMVGRVELTLSRRTVKQLESKKEEVKFLDTIEMLGVKDVTTLQNIPIEDDI